MEKDPDMLHFALPLPALIACLSWLLEHREALLCAARLLGGANAARRVGRILAATGDQVTITRLFLVEMDWLHGLLSLEHVGDPDREETAYFQEIDPEDPAVAEICELTEALREHISALRTEAQAIRSALRRAA